MSTKKSVSKTIVKDDENVLYVASKELPEQVLKSIENDYYVYETREELIESFPNDMCDADNDMDGCTVFKVTCTPIGTLRIPRNKVTIEAL